MTREERKLALYCLKASSNYHSEVCEECINYPNCDHTIQDDVTETIIKALELEPCEDAISRQATIEAFQMFRGYEANRTNAEWVDRIETVVEKLPPVNPQEKTGHWIGTKRVGCGFEEYIVSIKDGRVANGCHCSECGEWLIGSDEYDCYGKYCPNCGCRMVEPQEGSDKECTKKI